MKILRIINSLAIGGAERSIAGNLPYHIKNGFDMEVALLDGSDSFFTQELKKNNVKITFFGKKNNIYNPFIIIRICKIINKFDIIHVHLFPSLYWVAIAKLITRSKKKFVYTEHSTYNQRRDMPFMRFVDKFIYKQYDKIIAISPISNTNLANHLNENEKIITIYNGVDIFKVSNEAKINQDDLIIKYSGKKIIVQVAGFRVEKDQDTLIRALTLLSDDYVVFFIGDGVRKQICIELSKKLNVFDRIVFLGIQNNIGSYLNLANIVVVSSHWEGFGRAAIEGMALTKPVIATNVSGLSEVVQGAGLLFEVGEEYRLAELILKLTNDIDFYNEVAKRCYMRAKEYDIQKMIQEYENLYNKLMEK
jgi:glycosyltransferase involved in cell wall biosynthesis